MTKLIEDFQSILCAYKEANKGFKIVPKEIKLTKSQIDSQMSVVVPNRVFYGIMSVGKDTTMDLIMEEGCVFELTENRQIIEVFQAVDNIAGDNYFFRGWQLTIQ